MLGYKPTAGAVSMATIVRKMAGPKIEISPLRYMIDPSGFFHCTHICRSNIIGEKVLQSLTILQICRFNLTPKISPLILLQNRVQSS
jgi:hypothetical protein